MTARIIDPLALAAGVGRMPVDLWPKWVLDGPGLDGDSMERGTRIGYAVTDVASVHSHAAEC